RRLQHRADGPECVVPRCVVPLCVVPLCVVALMDFETLSRTLRAHRQEHLFSFWDELSAAECDVLVAQLEEFDFDQLERLAGSPAEGTESAAEKSRRAVPPALVVR